MVVRFVCVIRVPVCARVSRACPVCVPAPPGAPVSFYRYCTVLYRQGACFGREHGLEEAGRWMKSPPI